MKTTLCLVLLGLIMGSAFAAVTPSAFSATTASYNATPVKVFDYSNTTTGTPDASITATSIWTNGVIFGPGATNATIYVWALKYSPVAATSTPGVLTAVIKRTLNASQIVAAPTDTTESAVIAADATAAITTTNKLAQDPKLAVCPGYFALAAVAPGTTYAASTDMLMLWYVAGTGSSATAVTVDTSVTVSAVASSTATYPTFAVGAVWSEDNVFYVLYETQTQTGTSSATQAFAPASAKQTGINLQGVNVTSGKLQFTTTVAIVASLTISTSSYGQSILSPIGSGTNTSMSPTIQVLYKDTSAMKVMYAAVTKSTGAVATAATAVSAADATQSSTVNGLSSMPGGFIGSNYTYGIAISNSTQAMGASTVAVAYGLNADYNGSTTAGGVSQLATSTVGMPSLKGLFPYGTGFATLVSSPQSSGGPTYSVQAYFANGTANGSSLALGSSVAPVSAFIDVNGAVWFGYYAYDTQTTVTQGPTTGYIGRAVSNVNYYNATTTKAANVLATFAAILTFVIASLFMF